MITQYRHKEAFCLMWYSCACGHKELIWNSRDGVTPFGCQCPSCNQPTLLHTNWNSDTEYENYQLNNLQRFWRDGTKEDAIRIVHKRAEVAKQRGYTMPEDMIARLIDNINNDSCDEFPKGWPVLDQYISDNSVQSNDAEQPARKPLSDKQIERIEKKIDFDSPYTIITQAIRLAEKAHGIGVEE